MTDTTKTRPFEDTTRGDDTKPCKECNSPDHTTLGHFEGNGIEVSPEGHFEGNSIEEGDDTEVTTQGHFEGNSIPTGTTN
jgi:hypothetical protein